MARGANDDKHGKYESGSAGWCVGGWGERNIFHVWRSVGMSRGGWLNNDILCDSCNYKTDFEVCQVYARLRAIESGDCISFTKVIR